MITLHAYNQETSASVFLRSNGFFFKMVVLTVASEISVADSEVQVRQQTTILTHKLSFAIQMNTVL